VQRVTLLVKEVSMSRRRIITSLAALTLLVAATARLAVAWFPLSGGVQESTAAQAPPRGPIRVGSNVQESKLLSKGSAAEPMSLTTGMENRGEASLWYLIAAADAGKRPRHRGQYQFWKENGVVRGAMILHGGMGTRPLYDLEFDGETLLFRQQPATPRLILRARGDRFEGGWEEELGPPLVLVQAWED
jgi:hypothetical protein